MIHDILTVALKEWKEILFQRATLRGGILASLVLPLGLLGVFLPAQAGREWLSSGVSALMWTWFPLFITSTLICESFAGERERHTLETLLASRLSDTAILFGKIVGGVGYGWGIALGALMLSLITVNVVERHGGRFIMFDATMTAAVVVLSLLGAALAAGAGVLISLRAKTVRQAQQTLSLSIMIVFFGVAFGVPALPAPQRDWVLRVFTGANLAKMVAALGVALAAADIVLILAAKARFKRALLVAD
jgi:ABC-2 type transport system permease protein